MSTGTLLLSSSRQPYRRGGLAIGSKHTPTRVRPGQIEAAACLAILRDPVITLVEEYAEDGGVTRVRRVSEKDREAAIAFIEAHLDDVIGGARTDDPEISALALGLLAEDDASEIEAAIDAAKSAPGGQLQPSTDGITNTAPEESPPAGAEPAVPAAEDGANDKGPSAASAAGKPAGKAKPKAATR